METIRLIQLENETMTVPEMRKMLGLGKTESYWILKHRNIETVTVMGQIRVVKTSFEDWYARQVKYHKTDGTPPGRVLNENSYSVRDLMDLLDVSDSTIYDHIKCGDLEAFENDYQTRITRKSFEKWYASQDRHRLPDDREGDAQILETTYSMTEVGRRLSIDCRKVYGLLSSGKHGPVCEFVTIAGHRRVTIESYNAWFAVQTKYSAQESVSEPLKPVSEEAPPIEIEEKAFYRLDEAARLIGVSKKKLYRILESEDIMIIKAGASILIPADEVKRLKDERRQ